jgi:cytochrome oxidase Cu insertion factor (SCO1/SenC/PrrC family)
MTRRGVGALSLLGLVLAITAAWWALALWPLPAEAPVWLTRTRLACFGAAPDALPDGAGWLALVGQPVLMLGLLALLAGEALREGMRALALAPLGRAALGAGLTALLGGGVVAALRVVEAGAESRLAAQPVPPADAYPRLERPAPALGLVDQHGATVGVEQFLGRPILLTFAFAHCETVCPLLVNDVVAARRRLVNDSVAVLIVTLDPYRDVPTRLPSIATRWGLGAEEHVLSGAVPVVERALERWGVAAQRDSLTGDVVHPALVYVIDRSGRIAFSALGGADALVALVRRL